MVLLHEMNDQVTQVINKLVGSIFMITAFICIYEFGYLFPLQGFIRDGFRYYNMSLAQLHLNKQTTVSAFDNLLRVLKKKPSINIFRHCYTLINNVDEGPFIPQFFTFSTKTKRPLKGIFQEKSSHVRKWRRKWVLVKFDSMAKPYLGYVVIQGCFHFQRVPYVVVTKNLASTRERIEYAVRYVSTIHNTKSIIWLKDFLALLILVCHFLNLSFQFSILFII